MPRSEETLPVVTVARFREALALVQRFVADNTQEFIENGQSYRERHRAATGRSLSYRELSEVAAGLATDLADARGQVEAANIVVHEDPQPIELLAVAGVATSPAMFDGMRRFVALMELPDKDFEQHREAGTLPGALDAAAVAMESEAMSVVRGRAAEAWAVFAAAAGYEPGKAMGLAIQSLWQIVSQAMGHLTVEQISSLSTDSPAPTDGPVEPFSTTQPGPTLST